MNKLYSIHLIPQYQYNSKYTGDKILDIYAPWGAIT